ncbi:hypothetical protein J2T13_001584 [Paenibacillus sp. DS2015]
MLSVIGQGGGAKSGGKTISEQIDRDQALLTDPRVVPCIPQKLILS